MSRDIAAALNEEHQRVHDMRTALLDARDRYLARGEERRWNLAARLLREFAGHVDRHFSFEEEEGFLIDVTRRRPTLAGRVAHLRADHEALRNGLLDLVAMVGTASGEEPRRQLLGARLDLVLARLQAHEREENALVQEAFLQDTGTTD
jgi:hypothetical protein